MENSGRPLTAKEKRQEQLKRWQDSATDAESSVVQNNKQKVKFDDGAVFLAACSSGDLDEVQILINKGADINFANVDGLTALHQACIDGNLEVAEFLVDSGAEIDQEDNEGWTPLHAAASCGFMDIASYLVLKGANVVAVNSEGEVPLDIAEDDDMVEFLTAEIDNQGLNIDDARNSERESMTVDAKQQLNAVRSGETPQVYRHPKSGASALHVAAAKGYINVIKILLQAGMDVNVQDNDGWAPLHAASHWSQEQAAKLLADKNADFNLRSKLGQTPCNVADEDMLGYLEELKEDQEKHRAEMKELNIIEPPTIKSSQFSSGQNRDDKYPEKKPVENHNIAPSRKDLSESNHGDINSISSEDDDVDSTSSSEVASSKTPQQSSKEQKVESTAPEQFKIPYGISRTGSAGSVNASSADTNNLPRLRQSSSGSSVVPSSGLSGRNKTRPASLHISSTQPKEAGRPMMSATDCSRSRPVAATQPVQTSGSFSSKSSNGSTEKPSTPTERNVEIKENAPNTWRLGLRKTGSFDDKMRPLPRGSSSGSFGRLTDFPKSSEDTISSTGDASRTARVAPILDGRITSKLRQGEDSDSSSSERYSFQRTGARDRFGGDSSKSSAPMTYKRRSEDETPASTKPTNTSSKFLAPPEVSGDARPEKRRSHLQPVRDEEAEAQRKARSRRERQSRRSTQGVTLDVYEEAKKTIENMKSERSENNASFNKKSDTSDLAIPDNPIPHTDSATLLHRRWDKTGAGSNPTGSSRAVTLPSGYIPSNERVAGTPKTASVNPAVSIPTITVPDEDDTEKQIEEDAKKANEKSPDVNPRKSAALQRRRQRKERRSTGLPGLASDAGNDVASDDEEAKPISDATTPTKAERLRATASRYESNAQSDRSNRRASSKTTDPEPSKYSSTSDKQDGKDFKKLYDEQIDENKKLKNELAEAKREIAELEAKLSHAEDPAVQRRTLETEKRERRALERKLAEVEKELMDNSKEELLSKNKALKLENQSLTRLVNKLSEADTTMPGLPTPDMDKSEHLHSKRNPKGAKRYSNLYSNEDIVDSSSRGSDRDTYLYSTQSSEGRNGKERKPAYSGHYSTTDAPLSSRSTKSLYQPRSESSYKSDSSISRGGSERMESSDRWTSSRPLSSYSGSYKDRDQDSTLSSTPYNTYSSRNKLSSSNRASGNPAPPTESKYSSSYRNRVYDPPVSHSRPPISSYSTGSKRVGNLMDSRSTLQR